MTKNQEESLPESPESDYDVIKYKKEKAIREQRKKYGQVVVKGRMRDDKRVKTYSVTIPAPIRGQLGLVGGEYFLIRTKKNEIVLKLIQTQESEEDLDE